ncbi:MAG: M28 family peptidase [Acidobacteriia bacterium]|nr:M28 family peptidase [Terriglobia bacterium]
MITNTRILLTGLCALTCLFGQEPAISPERIRAHVRFLSGDLLEGRGPGTRGGDLATEYIANQFELAGLKPAADAGTFFQPVPLIGIATQASAQLSASKDDRALDFKWEQEFVGVNEKLTAEDQFEAEAIFVGHGIVAPEYQWNDFKDVDVRGKVLVLFTNEPSSNDPKFFGGRALTYYGRWSYKYEEATRKGAVGVIIIHTTPTAGYSWEVVRNSWSREQPYVKLVPGQEALSLAGWVSKDAGEKLVGLAGHHVDDLLKASEARDFRPIPLGVRIRCNLPTKVRDISTRNVAGLVEGSDPKLKSEVVIYSAHWDHLGIGTPVNGDAIYNGAVDNATGCGILMELARAWAAQPRKPRRSALFLAVTAEEGGLRGSEYYAGHPEIPAGKTALAINYDGLFPFGRTRDVVVNGAERTTVWPVVEAIARRMELTIHPDPRPEQGAYYRSDHFAFAHIGVPAFSVEEGDDFIGKPKGFGAKAFEDYNAKHYHAPSDEFQESWDFSGLAEMARFGFLIGTEVANQERLPSWRAGDEFLPAREKSGVR